MDPGRRTGRLEEPEQIRQRDPYRGDRDQRLRVGGVGSEQGGIHEHGGGLRGERRTQILLVGRERQGGLVDGVDACDVFDHDRGVTDDASAGPLRNRAERPEPAHGEGVPLSSILRIFSTSGVMSTPPKPTYWRVKTYLRWRCA